MWSKIQIILVLFAIVIPKNVYMTVIYIELNDYNENQEVQIKLPNNDTLSITLNLKRFKPSDVLKVDNSTLSTPITDFVTPTPLTISKPTTEESTTYPEYSSTTLQSNQEIYNSTSISNKDGLKINEGNTTENPLIRAKNTSLSRHSSPPEDLEVSGEVESSGDYDYEPEVEATTITGSIPVTTTITTSNASSNITENSAITQQSSKEIFNNTEILKKENDLVITRILTPPEDLEVSEEDEYSGSGDYDYEPEVKETTALKPVTSTTTTTTSAPEVSTTSTESSSITDQSNQKILNNTDTDTVLTRLSTPPEDLEVSAEVEGSGDLQGSGDHHGSGDHQGSGDGINGPQIEGTPRSGKHLSKKDIHSNILERQKEDFYF